MIKLGTSQTTFTNGTITVSANAIKASMKTLHIPEDLMNKLATIGQSANKEWAEEAGRTLLALTKPTTQLSSTLRSNLADFIKVTDARFDFFANKRPIGTAGKYKNAKVLSEIEECSNAILGSMFPFNVGK